ncbi:MAG: 50S ribosomal protein L11 methyltransferase [Deltaproteobacteria bacterium]|nr:50S ribosomal protein L11 methyltransferase [Deltaproteobacteria bacterium]
MTANWFEITAQGPAETAEKIIAFLISTGSRGVLEEEQDGKKILRAYIPADSPLRKTKIKLNEQLKAYGWSCKAGLFENQDWLAKWKEHIKPIRVSDRLVIKPTWKKAAKKPGRIIIEIDPGMAFGTGSHASTMMCLKAADKLADNIKGKDIFDVGTGSGILAITAAKLGAKNVVGIDIDPEAVKVARKNIRFNKVSGNVKITAKPLEEIKGKFSVIFANIIAEELVKIANLLKSRTADNGFLILSGILKDRAEEVEASYKELGFRPFKSYSKGEWKCLVFYKRGC